ncbi:GreA/GreB family elongation factor [bacterium]|nr:GreA/GreB family elongation factor [bacterium]MBU1676604.1 GreA/GreB family elongation factor [bacterium]
MNLIKLKKLANARQFNDLEGLWPDALDDEDVELDDLLPIIGQVRRLGEQERAETLLQLVLTSVEEKCGKGARLDTAVAGTQHLPASAYLRRELKRLYRASHADYEHLSGLLDVLLDESVSLPGGVDSVRRYLRLRPGAFFSDRSHLEPGMVVAVDEKTAELKVSFSGRHETMNADQIAKVIILPKDHFPSLIIYRPDELRALAGDDPAGFVLMALASTRNLSCSYRDLRKSVVTLMGEGAWAGWWKRARPLLKKSTRLDIGSGTQPTFRVLKQERSYEDRVRERFEGITDPEELLEFVLDYLVGIRKEKDVDTDLLLAMGNAAARLAGRLLEKDPVLTLVCLAIHSTVAGRGVPVAKMNPQAAVSVLSRVTDPGLMPTRLNDRMLQAVLEFLRKAQPDDWVRTWGWILPRTGRMVCDHMARELLAAGETGILAEALVTVLEHPTASPDVLCWLWRARHTDTKTAATLIALPGLDTGRVLFGLLELMDATGRMTALSDDKRLRKVIDQAQETLSLQDGEPIRRYIAKIDKPDAHALKDRIEASGGLRPSTRTSLLTFLRGAHPEIFVEGARPWEEDVYYTTESGLNRRQGELDHLVQDALPAVAKQIGEAASHGDLSENAEYTAALEKRDQITSTATRIESELAKAKMIDPEMARTDFVNIGTRVLVRDLVSEREENLTFLGVWDSAPESGVLSYNAPLALAFMGNRVGDQVEYGKEGERRRWEIVAIEPAI